MQEIFKILTEEEKVVFREAFSKFDRDGNGQISTKVTASLKFMGSNPAFFTGSKPRGQTGSLNVLLDGGPSYRQIIRQIYIFSRFIF